MAVISADTDDLHLKHLYVFLNAKKSSSLDYAEQRRSVKSRRTPQLLKNEVKQKAVSIVRKEHLKKG